MQCRGTIITAAVVLTLISTVNAQVVLTINGIDATKEFAEVNGKGNLVVAVSDSTEAEPNAYRIEATGGLLEAQAAADTYTFTFESDFVPGLVRMVANNDMVIGGTTVKAGESIYELFLIYSEETDSVTAFGMSLEVILGTGPEAEPEATAAIQTEPEVEPEVGLTSSPQAAAVIQTEPELQTEVAAEAEYVPVLRAKPKPAPYFVTESGAKSQPRSFRTLSKETAEKMARLKQYPEAGPSSLCYAEAGGDLSFKGWGVADGNELRAGYAETVEGIDRGLMSCGSVGGEGGGSGMLAMDVGDYVNVPAGPLTENTIWDSNVHLLGRVEVNNVMLVIKPGVEVRIINGNSGIVVRNNGCIIANGTPDKMIYFFPEYRQQYVGYNYAIKLEETASPLCEISYCQMYCAIYGILSLNKRLESPIHDNSLWDCWYGIRQLGPNLTDVVNNEVYNPTDPEMISPYLLPAGIDVNLADASGVASNTTEIYIGNNTIAGKQTYGILVSGVADPNKAGTVIIANNFIAGSRDTAVCLVNGWMRSLVICNGFYLNNHNMNVGGGGSLGEYVRSPNSVTVEDFNSYDSSEDLTAIWKDHSTLPVGWQTSAQVYAVGSVDWPDFVLEGNSMKYWYRNNLSPYYSECRADVVNLPSEIGTDWTRDGVDTLTLYFYGQLGNDTNEQMYVKLSDGDDEDFYVVDNFNGTYSTNINDTWTDYDTQSAPVTSAQIYARSDPNCDPPRAMKYWYRNDLDPYYSEARAKIGEGDGKLHITSDWSGLDTEILALWFYGDPNNDANEQMYITLTDGSGASGRVNYPDMNDIREKSWHKWEIYIAFFVFDNFSLDLADINKITIGFGDGTQPAGDGVVYFDDIRLYSGDSPPMEHTAKAAYNGGAYNLMEEWWHVWNIPLAEFSDINLANVKTIAIGFGDGNEPAGDGVVYFDEIILGQGNADEPFYDGAVELEEDEDPFVFGFDDDNDPLYLKQGCRLIEAGAGYIDEYPYLIGKASCVYQVPDTNELHGIPDTNMVNIGCHYFDWNYAYGTLKSDLYRDKVVNFVDFAFLAAGWLTVYDMEDLISMADEWLEVAEPNLPLNIAGDANTGFVEVGVEGYSSDTQRIFLLIDGQYAGEISGFRGGWPFMLDVSRLGPGTHQLKAVSVDNEGSVTCSNLSENIFNCFINYCLCTDAYDFNEPHNFCAFYTGPSDISVKVYNEDDNLVWSQTYAAENLCGFIPAGVTSANDLDYIVFEEIQSGGMMALGGSGGSGAGSVTKGIGITFDPEDIPANISALLILPDFGVNLLNDVDNVVRAAFESRGVQYYELKGSNATYENLSWFAHNRYIRYIYYAGHGGYGVNPDTGEEYFGEGIRRTIIELADGQQVVSVKNSDFPEGTAPSWCVPLKGERSYQSIYKLKKFLPGELKFVHLDTCFSGRLRLTSTHDLIEGQAGSVGLLEIPESDMSWAFNMTGTDIYGQFCQGWWNEKKVGSGQTNYEVFGILEWTKLKDGKNLYQSLDETVRDPNVRYYESCESFRIYGMKDMTAVKIE